MTLLRQRGAVAAALSLRTHGLQPSLARRDLSGLPQLVAELEFIQS